MGRMQTHPTHYPTDMKDDEWDYIKSLVPAAKSGKGRRGRPPALDRRSLVNAIFYVVRSGCAWRLLPSDFGPWQTVYGCFRRWSQDWTWTFIHDTLVGMYGRLQIILADGGYLGALVNWVKQLRPF